MISNICEKYPDLNALPNEPNDTSKAYKVDGFTGQIGFITSMTEHFCGSCNRLRLTADGNLKVIAHFCVLFVAHSNKNKYQLTIRFACSVTKRFH